VVGVAGIEHQSAHDPRRCQNAHDPNELAKGEAGGEGDPPESEDGGATEGRDCGRFVTNAQAQHSALKSILQQRKRDCAGVAMRAARSARGLRPSG
jgi:hypothetical protein